MKERSQIEQGITFMVYILLYMLVFGVIAYTGLMVTYFIWRMLPLSQPLNQLPQNAKKYRLTTAAGRTITRHLVMPLVDTAVKTVVKQPLKIFPFIGSVMVTTLPILRPIGNFLNATGRVLKIIPPKRNIANESELIEQQANEMTTSIQSLDNITNHLSFESTGSGEEEWVLTPDSFLDRLIHKVKPEQFDVNNILLFIFVYIIVTTLISISLYKVTNKTMQDLNIKNTVNRKKITRARKHHVMIKEPTFSHLKKLQNQEQDDK